MFVVFENSVFVGIRKTQWNARILQRSLSSFDKSPLDSAIVEVESLEAFYVVCNVENSFRQEEISYATR